MVEPKINGKNKSAENTLPLSRIKTIMKSSVETGQITNEVLFVVSKSAEYFIQHLTRNAFKGVNSGNTLKYEDLSKYVQEEENLEFLLQIIPQKITVKEFRRILSEGRNDDSNESDSTSESGAEANEAKITKRKTKK